VIVRSTVELGRNLGLRVVAEGVETVAVWNRLAELRCDQAQGHLLSPPVAAAELTRWLAERARAAAPRPPAAASAPDARERRAARSVRAVGPAARR